MFNNSKANMFDTQEFRDQMAMRISDALLKDAAYEKYEAELSAAVKAKDITQITEKQNQVQGRAEEVAYIQGWKDAFAMVLASLG